jgi:hypothetical protein
MRDYFACMQTRGVGYGEEEDEVIEIERQVSLGLVVDPSGRTDVRPLLFSALASSLAFAKHRRTTPSAIAPAASQSSPQFALPHPS